ncbi:MAG: ATP-binding protein, partial [Lachnospiraceae bacterium]|nr:ATP-binding protein [Lachnospiraceae bacterium]
LREWYDGYLFGKTEVYNPWSVLNYVKGAAVYGEEFPKPYWSNTSSNSIVKELVEEADFETRTEIEHLIEGGTIEKPVHEDITYNDIHTSQDNLWNFLFFTGYLKKVGERFEADQLYLEMAIPNREIRYVYRRMILSWFDQKVKATDRSALLRALENGDCKAIGDFLTEQMQDSISFFDYAESYYHGFLVGLLKGLGRYHVTSNRESGNGRPDIIMQAVSVRGKAFIFELKTAKEFQRLEAGCKEAVAQAARENYRAELEHVGYSDITVYGVCFYRKECMVEKG